MMNKFLPGFIFLIVICYNAHSQENLVELNIESDYQGWGWETLVIHNNLITVAVVPSIGGRIMQYCIGTDTIMRVNESLFGEVFYDGGSGPWNGTWGYGAYKTWPAPQSEWGWPPPPTLAWGNYEYEILKETEDTVSIWLQGETETELTPGLRFDRYIEVYSNSTKVKITTHLYNENEDEQSWSIWDVTQQIVQHENEGDYSNFSVYFPVESSSDVWPAGSVPDRGEITPGVYKVNYSPQDGKIFARVNEGWACFVDERDQQSYAKVFNINPDNTYPDDGAMVEVYTSGSSDYLELEVLSPIEAIGPLGDDMKFTEYWYATKSDGPVHFAGEAGMLKTPLNYNTESNMLTGEFGAYHNGSFEILFLDETSTILQVADTYVADPMIPVNLNLNAELAENTRYIEIRSYNQSDDYLGILDRLDLDAVVASPELTINNETQIRLWPGVIESGGDLNIQLSGYGQQFTRLEILSINGSVVYQDYFKISGNTSRLTIDLPYISGGIYFVRFTGNKRSLTEKFIVK
ncbi:MAG: DUF4380 domain-containing protein [Bacteroidales bacterium]|nr:DUF4380 domain-containing protein [Bacteroidales bacterium]